MINGGSSSQSIYFSHRKGWTVETEKTLQPEYVDSLHKLGANYLVIDKKASKNEMYPYLKIRSNSFYDLYKLTQIKNKSGEY